MCDVSVQPWNVKLHVHVDKWTKSMCKKKKFMIPTWFEHATFWSGVRCATIAPQDLHYLINVVFMLWQWVIASYTYVHMETPYVCTMHEWMLVQVYIWLLSTRIHHTHIKTYYTYCTTPSSLVCPSYQGYRCLCNLLCLCWNYSRRHRNCDVSIPSHSI